MFLMFRKMISYLMIRFIKIYNMARPMRPKNKYTRLPWRRMRIISYPNFPINTNFK